MFPHPQQVYAQHLKAELHPGLHWLDIGCGRQIVPDWAWPSADQQRALTGVELTGLDTDAAIHEHPFLHHKLIGLADRIDVPDRHFDLVTCNMVMEHVPTPDVVFREVFRVLKPGGTFLIHTPNKWYYLLVLGSFAPDWLKHRVIWFLESRAEADVFPTFYRANTAGAMKKWAGMTGFSLRSVLHTAPYASFEKVPVVRELERAVLLPMFRQQWAEKLRATLIVKLVRPHASPSEEQASLARLRPA